MLHRAATSGPAQLYPATTRQAPPEYDVRPDGLQTVEVLSVLLWEH